MGGNRYLVNEREGEQVLENWTSGYTLFIMLPSVLSPGYITFSISTNVSETSVQYAIVPADRLDYPFAPPNGISWLLVFFPTAFNARMRMLGVVIA